MFALASANAGLVSYAGLPYASPLFARAAVPAISQFSHVDYKAYPTYTPVAVSAPLAYHAAPLAYHAAPYAYSAPIAYSAPAIVAAPAVALAKAPATYTAQTRGSFHQAPLEGHEVSQTSLNVEPASGTW
jgi:Cuticle protein